MNRVVKNPAVVMLMVFATAFPAISRAQGGKSPLMPPQSNAFGRSLEEWSALQTEYAIATGLGGASLSNTVDGVRLLPGDFVNSTPVFDITLAPGTRFVASPFFLFGELYDDGSSDDPDVLAPFIKDILDNTQILIELDGRVLLEGSGAELQDYIWGPVWLPEPVVYKEPIPRGPGLNAVAALWTIGFGAVYNPLSIGRHTLIYTVQSPFFVSESNPSGISVFTYNLTVSPK
jgi:hypothetical protein